mmetsp:Transcript_17525/g.37881  ORF Transcript_17525/g.37881 Transcript_17525/m.37881 type:complete len:200 (+) Transcript_17525:1399-1998(+)
MTMTIKTRYVKRTRLRLSVFRRNSGRPMLTARLCFPSGFPYFSQFSFATGSVRASYAFATIINIASAAGLLGFLSGWYFKLIFLYAFLISFSSAPVSISRMEKGSKEFTSPLDWTERYNQRKTADMRIVMRKLTMKPGELSVLRPLLVFFKSAAFFFSAEVRETAPMSSSLVKRAALTLLMIVYHDGTRYIVMKLRATK